MSHSPMSRKVTHILKYFTEMSPIQRQVAKEYIAEKTGITVKILQDYIEGKAYPKDKKLREDLNIITGRDLRYGNIETTSTAKES